MEAILGAGGVIGNEISKVLYKKGIPVRQISRNPQMVNDNDDLFPSDLTDREKVIEALKGCAIAYLTVGLPYDVRVWKEKWPVIMENVIEACEINNCKLVFFDNVYMYGRIAGSMTEQSPYNPVSEKGKVRAQIAGMLEQAMSDGGIEALIARSADFYGPGAKLGVANVLVFDNLNKGKKPMILADPRKIHSYTYTVDAANACVLLAHSEDAYGDIWHLPTSNETLTSADFTIKAAAVFNRSKRYYVLKKWMVSLVGFFNKQMKEIPEMMYQNDSDYYFDSTKFQNRFPDFTITSYDQGIRNTAEVYWQ